MSLRIDQIVTTRVLPKTTDYAEVGNATPESAKLLLQSIPQKVATIAALKALVITTAADAVAVLVQGYYTEGDGGGGLFRYSSASALADNGGTIIAPDAGAGRWLRDYDNSVSVLAFGAKGDGATNDLTKFQAAIDFIGAAGGGTVIAGRGKNYVLTNRLLITADDVTLKIEANTTLTVSGWVYSGTQDPFGSQILISGRRCAVLGDGPSSLIQLAGGSLANGITFLHRSKGRVANLTIDGDKDSTASIADDTFESGIEVVNDSTLNPEPTDKGEFVIENCTVRNFGHYGINLYGDLANYITVRNCLSYGHGKAGDALSVGTGIVMTRGINNITVENCQIYGNKSSGIDLSSAGKAVDTISILNCQIRDNDNLGIVVHEEATYGSIAGVGINGLVIAGNQILGNGASGLSIGTFDDVGVISNFTVSDNIVRNNTTYGIVILSNTNAAANTVSLGIITGNVVRSNGSDGITLNTYVRNVVVRGNLSLNNTGTQINDVSLLNDVCDNHNVSGMIFFQEGTFTPVVKGATAAGVGTYTTQSGRWSRLGNRIHFTAELAWTAHTGTGYITVDGLPVAAAAQNALVCFGDQLGAPVNSLQARTGAASTLIIPFSFAAGAAATIAIVGVATLIISGSYDV